ncbi:MAG TPA: nuclear transport factor 2 family protein [Usitatibacter sp.]|nr:nuclear transport factor 2 family protein [Usitatibacter sp.]
MSDDAVALVERQLAAYNARDLESFAATYAEDVKIYRMPSLEPAIQGQQQLREIYRRRFASPSLHAEILSRIVLGSKVIDHERVTGIADKPLEALAIYEISGGLISSVWFFYPAEPFPAGPQRSST